MNEVYYFHIPPIDFEEVWFFPAKDGMKLVEGEGCGAPFHFRLEIEANDRKNWHIAAISIVDYEFIGTHRTQEYVIPLDGNFLKETAGFFSASEKFRDIIQDKVDLQIVDED